MGNIPGKCLAANADQEETSMIPYFQKGDLSSFMEIWIFQWPHLHQYALTEVNDHSIANRIIISNLLKMWEQRAGFHNNTAVADFLMSSIRHDCHQYQAFFKKELKGGLLQIKHAPVETDLAEMHWHLLRQQYDELVMPRIPSELIARHYFTLQDADDIATLLHQEADAVRAHQEQSRRFLEQHLRFIV